MKYLDTGSRDPKATLAHWLSEVLTDEITELRLQSGFFSLSSVGLFIPTLERLKKTNNHTAILIGSNDCSTIRNDVIGLAELIGIPRAGALLGVVSFSGGAYFHPKTYHITRNDGSQAAFVGSANLTGFGLTLHVEAGLTLDTRDGDCADQVGQVGSAIDEWFITSRSGMTVVNSAKTIADLFDAGILAEVRPPRPSIASNQKNVSGAIARPKLATLFSLPKTPAVASAHITVAPAIPQQSTPVAPAATSAATAASPPSQATVGSVSTQATSAAASAAQGLAVSVPLKGFPQYLLFKPNPVNNDPTFGAAALSGATLPSNVEGLILQLNKDSARHFEGGTGTANVSIPVVTVSTLRFGLNGKNNSPGSKFNLHMRYIGHLSTISGGIVSTSIKGYGYTANETGSQDIRMVVPAASRLLGEKVRSAGYPIPSSQDLALLEWPTPSAPEFRLSFVEPLSPLGNQVDALFANALATGQLVGKGACWLPAGLSPIW